MDKATGPPITLGISDEPGSPLVGHPFIGSFVSLGARLRRFSGRPDGRQLIVALSVPTRDYVAALIGAGWMLKASPPELQEPEHVFQSVEKETCIRAVTEDVIVTGKFVRLERHPSGPRVLTGGQLRPVNYYRAVAVLQEECEQVSGAVPEAGYLGSLTGADKSWLARVACPAQDLALIGVAKWLREDLEALVGNALVDGEPGTPLSNYLLPKGRGVATWGTEIIPSAQVGEGHGLRAECLLAVLDRYGAIKYLNDIETPIVVCVIDRSVADDSAAELIVQARIANSQRFLIAQNLAWTPPSGVEAMAFTVML